MEYPGGTSSRMARNRWCGSGLRASGPGADVAVRVGGLCVFASGSDRPHPSSTLQYPSIVPSERLLEYSPTAGLPRLCVLQVQIDRIMDEIDIDHDGKVRPNKQTNTDTVLCGYSAYVLWWFSTPLSVHHGFRMLNLSLSCCTPACIPRPQK